MDTIFVRGELYVNFNFLINKIKTDSVSKKQLLKLCMPKVLKRNQSNPIQLVSTRLNKELNCSRKNQIDEIKTFQFNYLIRKFRNLENKGLKDITRLVGDFTSLHFLKNEEQLYLFIDENYEDELERRFNNILSLTHPHPELWNLFYKKKRMDCNLKELLTDREFIDYLEFISRSVEFIKNNCIPFDFFHLIGHKKFNGPFSIFLKALQNICAI